MSATTDFAVPTTYALGVGTSKLDWSVFGQICVCVIPAMAGVFIGNPLLGARYLVGSLLIVLGYYFFKRDRYRFMSLLVGVAPALSLLRGLFFYKSIFVFVTMGIVLWASVAWKEVLFVWEDLTWRAIALLCLVYWLLSVARVGTVDSNFRAMEFALTPLAIYLLANRRGYLATGLIGIGISVTAYAIAMLPYGTRLGEGELDDGQTIGNPILVGVPTALVLLLALTDRGRVLLLERKPMSRLVLGLVMAQWLILSGSRGSWLITIIGLIVVFACSRPSRKSILAVIAVGCVVTALLLTTERGSRITTVFDKTTDSSRSLQNRTSGRSTMWEVLPTIFAASPIWGWGPGTAADVDYEFAGRHLLFHSLYEQVIAECGLLGFIPLVCIIFSLLHRGYIHYRRFGEVTPLVGIIGFIFIGVSVTAFDFLSGIFIGLALMAREPGPRFVGREFLVRAEEEA
jgi:O-antigen ligase